MANLVKKNGGEWNPLRTMRELMRWDPFREMTPMLPELETASWMPSFDVTENKDSFVFKADLPGVKKEDVDISLTGNRLQISGKREVEHETKEDTYYAYERQFGTFNRTFTLPEGIDPEHAKSELKEGVLTLVVPKKIEAQAKKIPIGGSTSKS